MTAKTALYLKRAGTVLLSTVIFLTAAEVSLRIYLGAPKGLFLFSRLGDNGMYVKNATFVSAFGFFPYTIKTNSLGLRGEEPSPQKNGLRVAMLGDSITDGFFVNNEDTYPWLLQQILRKRRPGVEVINGAHGAGSVDKEYAIVREVIAPLNPDIVVLTFVTNDIREICGKTRDQMLSLEIKPTLSEKLMGFFYTRTAIGEVTLDVYLRDRFEMYRAQERHGEISKINYGQIEGGNNYAENAKLFEKRWGNWDGIILKEPFSSMTNGCIDDYFFVFGKLHDYCVQHHIRLVCVYFPSYSQVYDARTSMRMRDVLSRKCENLDVPFLDLTGPFRIEGSHQVLHLAPLDFHLNPEGNHLMAATVAEFLDQQKLLE
jgi:lysophospholipase L1-like esterase